MPPAEFLSAPMADIRPLFARAARGDPAAKDYFASLFPADSNCVLCDTPIGDERNVYVTADPAAPRMALLMPCCAACAALPPAVRRVRELALARRMWWQPRRTTAKRRGAPPKPRRARQGAANPPGGG